MFRFARWTAFLILVAFLGLQFFKPAKNLSRGPIPEDDLRALHEVPPAIRTQLEAACYDCHSNNTRYPWYAEIQPFGWWLAAHVRDGRRELNLSAFGRYPAKRQADKLDSIVDVLNERTMPLPSYTWGHPEAVLNDEEISKLVNWAESLRDKIEDEL